MSGRPVVRSPAALAAACLGLSCVPVLSPPGRADLSAGFRTGIKPEPVAAATATPKFDPRAPKGAAPVTHQADASVFRVAAGVHLASAFPNQDMPVDVGVGYVFTDVGLGDRKLHGVYGEFTPLATAGSWWRIVGGVRGEVQLADRGATKNGFTFLGRLGMETFASTAVAGDEKGMAMVGGAYGVYGIGGFIEAGGHRMPGGEEAVLLLVGVSVRFPASAGVLLIAR